MALKNDPCPDRLNATYCRQICGEQGARLPTMNDFTKTESVIRNFAFPGGSVQKLPSTAEDTKIRKGLLTIIGVTH